MNPAAVHSAWSIGISILAFSAYALKPVEVVDLRSRIGEGATVVLLTSAIIIARHAP